jgi:hypothetical protein
MTAASAFEIQQARKGLTFAASPFAVSSASFR